VLVIWYLSEPIGLIVKLFFIIKSEVLKTINYGFHVPNRPFKRLQIFHIISIYTILFLLDEVVAILIFHILQMALNPSLALKTYSVFIKIP